MTTIAVLGGTGYVGAAVVAEAARRGHPVIAVSRSAPVVPVDGVRYVEALAEQVLPDVVESADVVVAALSPRGDNVGTLPRVYGELVDLADSETRLIVVGGFGSLRPAPGAARFAEGDGMPPHVIGEAREMLAVLQVLQAAPESLDWLFVSPAQSFGAHRAPGPARGTYRVSDDVALFDADGTSTIEVADFALAVLDEIERPVHRRTQIGFVY